MAIVDRHGLPLAGSTHAANHHEVTLLQLSFHFYMIEAKPDNLIGDRANDSDPLDEQLREQGIEMIAPHKSDGRKSKTQGRTAPAPIRAALDRAAILCVASMATWPHGPMGVLRAELSRLCPACVHRHTAQAILR
jgi:hypothetical protein